MLIDASLLLADAQSSTVSAASTSHIDTTVGGGSKYVLYGEANVMPFFFVNITTAVTGGTSVAFSLQTDIVNTFDSALETLYSSGAIAVANLVKGYQLAVRIPKGIKRYVRGYVTIDGPITTGAWTMGFALDIDKNLNK
jgi:hypothetical protein